jgi:hypothetical protein
MKIRKRESISPINLMPYDTLSVTWHGDHGETVLVEDYVGREMVVDEALLVELDATECENLGLSGALGGIVGKAS